MKLLSLLLFTFFLAVAHADNKIKMNFNNEDIVKIVETYSKATGQKFILDPAVRGKATIVLQEPVSAEEAFNHLSTALALNGFSFSKQGDTLVIMSARNIQRNLIEVGTSVPSLKPERMYTWIYTLKNITASKVNREIRIICSKDGEMSVSESSNQLIITDWSSNLNRISDLMKELDKKPDPSVAHLIESSKKEAALQLKAQAKQKNEN